jgi:cytochrome c-type biogenesis protein CcmH/NrfG
MSDYRDQVNALLARIASLEEELRASKKPDDVVKPLRARITALEGEARAAGVENEALREQITFLKESLARSEDARKMAETTAKSELPGGCVVAAVIVLASVVLFSGVLAILSR